MSSQSQSVKSPEPKKVQALAHFESDHLQNLVNYAAKIKRAIESSPEHAALREMQMEIQNYCTKVISRHKCDPVRHAIDAKLEFIVEIPEDQLQIALRSAVEANKAAADPPGPPLEAQINTAGDAPNHPESKVVEMPAPTA